MIETASLGIVQSMTCSCVAGHQAPNGPISIVSFSIEPAEAVRPDAS
jgi:hypothetical protein